MKLTKLLTIGWRILFAGIFILSFGQTSPAYAADDVDLYIIHFEHNGDDFVPLETGRTYTIRVHNLGDADSSGMVTVTDTLPNHLTATDISGTGWDCVLGTLTCTRSDVLPSGQAYPDITVTVTVGVGAPESVINTATVSGGNDSILNNNTVFTTTDVDAKPDLIVTGYELRNADSSATINANDIQANVAFSIRLYVQNQGGAPTGIFYPGVFLDEKPNYGIDHDVFGEVTDFQDYRIAPINSVGFPQGGCLYYDDESDGLIDPLTVEIDPERGNYTRSSFNNALPAGASTTIDVYIGYPTGGNGDYNGSEYDDIRTGLPAGSYNIYLYVDPNCSAGQRESIEDNNSYGPINITIGGGGDINVTIGGNLMGTYPMESGESLVQAYNNAFGGPVVISSNNGTNIIASMQQLRRADMTQNLWPGIMQLMGLRQENLSDEYVFPRYSNLSTSEKYEILLLANFDNIDTNITVKIGSTIYGPYNVPQGTSYIFDPAAQGGPVVVSSDNGAEIIASLYQLKRPVSTSRWTGQSEMMGIPLSQLSDTYVFPIYDYTSLGLLPSLNFANVDTMSTNITVTIGGVLYGPYSLDAGTHMVVTYPSVMGGPVVISSDNGAKIIASMQQLRRLNLTVNEWTGIMQIMGLRQENLSDEYVFPRYSNLSTSEKYEILILANFDNIDTHVNVKIGDTSYGPYSVPQGTSYIFDPAVQGGPVVVSSDNGAEIIASLYQLKRSVSTTRWNDQSEMMGIPLSQLSDTYVFPIYDYTSPGLLPSLNFAIP